MRFVSGTQLKITDSGGNDVTAEASRSALQSDHCGWQAVSFRGVELNLNINLKPVTVPLPCCLHVFTLAIQA